MKVYDLSTKSFFIIDKKENLTNTMQLVTDDEEYRIKDTLAKNGEVYLDQNNVLVITGPKPAEYMVWDKGGVRWVVDTQKHVEYLENSRQTIWDKIKDRRSDQAYTGIRIDNDWFHTDEESLRNYQLCWVRSELPEFNPPHWKTMSGSFTIMTKELLEKIIAKAYDKGQHDFKIAEMHRQALWKSNDPLNYDFSTGWSETYQG